MECKQRKIQVIIFSIIRNPVVEQEKEEKNSYANYRNDNRFPKLKQTRFPVDISVLSGNVIDCNPKRRNKSKCEIKITVELNRNFVTKFDWFDVNFAINEE